MNCHEWSLKVPDNVYRTLREDVYRAYIARASVGGVDNSPIIETIMALRQEQAQLAGYANSAEFFMANKVI